MSDDKPKRPTSWGKLKERVEMLELRVAELQKVVRMIPLRERSLEEHRKYPTGEEPNP